MKKLHLHFSSVLTLLILTLISQSDRVFASQSDLDPTFGIGGKTIWSPNNNTESRAGVGMVVQPDGKIVMVGGYTETQGTSIILVVRFNPNGSIDTTFGTNGVVNVNFGANSESPVAIDIQPDGKLIVCGRTSVTGSQDVGVARLNPDGSYDQTFYVGGKVVFGFTVNGSPDFDWPSVVKVGAGGKIWVGGSTGPGPNILYYRHLARLNSDGTLDQTFGNGGRIIEGLGSGGWEDLLPNDDGSVIAAGDSSAQFSSSVFVQKIGNTGSTLWGWGRTVQPGCYMSLNSLARQQDGKILVGGSDQCNASIVRLNTGGSLDNTFAMTLVQGTQVINALAVQPDGKVLGAIGFQSHGDDGYSLARYNTDGSPDMTFGSGGIKRLRVLNGSESASGIVIQPDGKFLLGGAVSLQFTGGYRFGLVRYKGLSVPVTTQFDYDGDGKADVSVFRPSENKWYIFRSSDNGVTEQIFAVSGDVPVPSDFDGDGRTDMAIYRPSLGDWWSLGTLNGNQNYAHWGEPGVIPLPSDFDGDGRTDHIYFLPLNSTWYRYGSTAGASYRTFGLAGDKPVIGDFDGDGKSDVAIYRPSDGNWWWQSSVDNVQRATRWGISTDIPAPADFDGDGKTDFAVFRPSTGVWYIYNSATGTSTIGPFGLTGDKPVPADYDGDGRADIAVFRPSTGIWYLLRSTSGFSALQFGVSTDVPTPAAFIP